MLVTARARSREPQTRSLVTMAEYSRIRGCTRAAVTLAAKRGQIHLVDGMVDPLDADKTWPKTSGPKSSNNGNGTGVQTSAPPSASPPANEEQRPKDLDYWDERANHERIKARLAELELAQQEGKLLNAEDVERDIYEGYRVVRDSLLNVPDRAASACAAEKDEEAIRRLLDSLIRQALTELNADLRPAD
jgi:hypothetical protein